MPLQIKNWETAWGQVNSITQNKQEDLEWHDISLQRFYNPLLCNNSLVDDKLYPEPVTPQTMPSTTLIVKWIFPSHREWRRGGLEARLMTTPPHPPYTFISTKLPRLNCGQSRRHALNWQDVWNWVKVRTLHCNNRRWRRRSTESAQKVVLFWTLHSAMPGRDCGLHSFHVCRVCVCHG